MIDTAFTRQFGLRYPIALAPVPERSNAQLAIAVSEAGGLGMIGCGSNDPAWIKEEFEKTGETAVGCGLHCDAVRSDPAILSTAINGRPRAVYLSNGDPRAHAEILQTARVRVICEVTSLSDTAKAVEAGADTVVARGTGAAGERGHRTMFNLIPEVADYLRTHADDTTLLAFGGVVDARTLASAITLGADGAMMFTRLALSKECSETAKTDALSCNGDHAGDLSAAYSQGLGTLRDAPAVKEILETISRRTERILSHSIRAVIK